MKPAIITRTATPPMTPPAIAPVEDDDFGGLVFVTEVEGLGARELDEPLFPEAEVEDDMLEMVAVGGACAELSGESPAFLANTGSNEPPVVTFR